MQSGETVEVEGQAETQMDRWNCDAYKGVNIQLLHKSSKQKGMEELHQNGHEYSDMSRRTTTTNYYNCCDLLD